MQPLAPAAAPRQPQCTVQLRGDEDAQHQSFPYLFYCIFSLKKNSVTVTSQLRGKKNKILRTAFRSRRIKLRVTFLEEPSCNWSARERHECSRNAQASARRLAEHTRGAFSAQDGGDGKTARRQLPCSLYETGGEGKLCQGAGCAQPAEPSSLCSLRTEHFHLLFPSRQHFFF